MLWVSVGSIFSDGYPCIASPADLLFNRDSQSVHVWLVVDASNDQIIAINDISVRRESSFSDSGQQRAKSRLFKTHLLGFDVSLFARSLLGLCSAVWASDDSQGSEGSDDSDVSDGSQQQCHPSIRTNVIRDNMCMCVICVIPPLIFL